MLTCLFKLCGKEFTFYIDLVKGTYAKNSISGEEYPINGMTIGAMFKDIKIKSVVFNIFNN